MKKVIAVFLVLVLCLTSCRSDNAPKTTDVIDASGETMETTIFEQITQADYDEINSAITTENTELSGINKSDEEVVFYNMDDPAFLERVENSIYTGLSDDLGDENYSVESVRAVYMSDRYYENLEFNFQENVYFGHTASELNDIFQGKKYIFTLENGKTLVRAVDDVQDGIDKQLIRNIAIGTGFILITVVVSIAVGKYGNVIKKGCNILISAAKSASLELLCSHEIYELVAYVLTGTEGWDADEKIREAILNVSEDFKWAAISGLLKEI